MDVCVVSFGGVCCSHVLQILNKNNITTNHLRDGDGLKHLYSPNTHKFNKKIKKIIYVYNDPLLALLSHYRRHWPYQQHLKIRGNQKKVDKKTCNTYSKLEELTISNGQDVYGLEDHFNEWYKYKGNVPILFIDLRQSDANDVINKFLGSNVTFDFKERNSNKTNCKSEMIKIYEELDTKIRDLINLKPKQTKNILQQFLGTQNIL